MIRTRPPEYKVYRRARERALRRLATAYPDQYKEYLEEEKAIEEGHKWTDINGTTSTVGIGSTITQVTDIREAGNDGQDKGDNGGEA